MCGRITPILHTEDILLNIKPFPTTFRKMPKRTAREHQTAAVQA